MIKNYQNKPLQYFPENCQSDIYYVIRCLNGRKHLNCNDLQDLIQILQITSISTFELLQNLFQKILFEVQKINQHFGTIFTNAQSQKSHQKLCLSKFFNNGLPIEKQIFQRLVQTINKRFRAQTHKKILGLFLQSSDITITTKPEGKLNKINIQNFDLQNLELILRNYYQTAAALENSIRNTFSFIKESQKSNPDSDAKSRDERFLQFLSHFSSSDSTFRDIKRWLYHNQNFCWENDDFNDLKQHYKKLATFIVNFMDTEQQKKNLQTVEQVLTNNDSTPPKWEGWMPFCSRNKILIYKGSSQMDLKVKSLVDEKNAFDMVKMIMEAQMKGGNVEMILFDMFGQFLKVQINDFDTNQEVETKLKAFLKSCEIHFPQLKNLHKNNMNLDLIEISEIQFKDNKTERTNIKQIQGRVKIRNIGNQILQTQNEVQFGNLCSKNQEQKQTIKNGNQSDSSSQRQMGRRIFGNFKPTDNQIRKISFRFFKTEKLRF